MKASPCCSNCSITVSGGRAMCSLPEATLIVISQKFATLTSFLVGFVVQPRLPSRADRSTVAKDGQNRVGVEQQLHSMYGLNSFSGSSKSAATSICPFNIPKAAHRGFFVDCFAGLLGASVASGSPLESTIDHSSPRWISAMRSSQRTLAFTTVITCAAWWLAMAGGAHAGVVLAVGRRSPLPLSTLPATGIVALQPASSSNTEFITTPFGVAHLGVVRL